MKTSENYKTTKHIFASCFAFAMMFALKAQDKLTLMTGEEINVKVIELASDEVRFKMEDNIDGPTHLMPKKDIFSAKYANGTVEVFGVKKEQVTSTPTTYYDGEPIKVVTDTNEFLNGRNKKFNGPRLGFTIITNGTMAEQLASKGKNPFVTMIGWQFEQRIFTIDDGACGLIEFVPLIGGMEQGLFLPSANLLIGLRSGGKNAFEFAMGPNLSITGLGMVFAAGTNFRSGKINFPVNIAVVPSVGSKKDVYDSNTGKTTSQYFHTGFRFSLTVGFNSRKK